jgi:ribosomal protein S18 acetylase RimI-like enzyme
MSKQSTLTRARPSVRWLIQLDMPHVVALEREVAGLRWREDEFLETLRSIDTIGQVVEIDDRVNGFIIYRTTPQKSEAETCLQRLFPGKDTRPREPAIFPPPVQIELLNIAIAPIWQRRGLGQLLIRKPEQKLFQRGGHIRAVVPETNLAMQLFLHHSGYKAARVERGCFGERDGYLMVRCV